MGRKGKPTPRTNADCCDYRPGATTKLIFVARKNPRPDERKVAQIPIIVGGKPCPKKSLVRKPDGTRRCIDHIASTYKKQGDDD